MRLYSIPLSTLVLLLTSCASSPSASTDAPAIATTTAPKANATIDKGMTAEQVRNLMGAPENVKASDTAEGKLEIWAYSRAVTSQEMSPTSTHMVPAVGPDGKITTRSEPEFHLKTTTTREVILVAFLNGKVIEVNRSVSDNRTFR